MSKESEDIGPTKSQNILDVSMKGGTNHTNVSKILRLCGALSSSLFNKSLSNLATVLNLRRSLQTL